MSYSIRFTFEGKPPTKSTQPRKPTDEDFPEIKVSRSDFVRALDNALLALPKGKRTDLDLWIEYHNGEARIHTSGASTQISAQGRWPGVACVSLRTLKQLRPRIPDGDPLALSYREHRFCIQSFCFPADWRSLTEVGGSWPLGLPLHPTTLDFVKVGLRYSTEEIARQGLTSAVKGARYALVRATEQAAEILQSHGVPASIVKKFIEHQIAGDGTQAKSRKSRRKS